MAFIGFEEDYKEYKKEQEKENTVGTGNKISSSDMPDISEEDLAIITRSRRRHDCFTVYMQSDLNFYDKYYNMEDEPSEFVDEDLLAKAKSIKRIYKNFFAYNAAMKIRYKYIDALIDKYGGPDMFNLKLSAGGIKDWIPPIPIYSKNSPDYKYYLEGQFNISTEWDDETLDRIMEESVRKFEESHDVDSVGTVVEVMTDPMIINQLHMTDHSLSSSNSGIRRSSSYTNTFNGISTHDYEEMSKLIRSMIDPNDGNETSDDVSVGERKYFKLTEEALKEKYYLTPPIVSDDLKKSMDQGYYEEPEEDLDEMIVDPVSNRPMTRREYQNRTFVRQLASIGWNELRLMHKLGIGSNYEIKLMQQKERKRKRSRKKAQSFMSSLDILGTDIDTVSSISELDDIMCSDY